MIKAVHYLVFSMVFLFLGCSQMNPKQELNETIEGEWRGSPGMFQNVRLSFSSDGKMTGYDGCNHFGAQYHAEKGFLKLSYPPVSTMMMCSSNNHFKEFILHAVRFERKGSVMTLISSDGKKIAFELNSVSFPEGKYTVTSYIKDKHFVSPSPSISIEFSSNGKVSGSMGCNRYFASYTDKANRLYLSYPALTRMNCEPSVMEQENAFLELFSRIGQYKVFEDRIRLYDSNGLTVIEMTKQ